MGDEYRIVIFEVDTPASQEREGTRYKVVAYDKATDKRADYVYDDDPEKGVDRLMKRLPYDARFTVHRR
jgi:hypothetical protein